MAKKKYSVYGYVDDILGISSKKEAKEAYNYLLKLLLDLGFPVSEKKLVEPTTRCNCLGLMVDTVAQTISIPEGKEVEILDKCRDILSHKFVTKRKFQSLIGSIMYIHKCVKSSRFFTNRLLEALRDNKSNFITISEEIKQDIQWFLKFTPLFDGYTQYVKTPVQHVHTIAIDACLKGVGGVWGSAVYTAPLPDSWIDNKNFNINHFEMINILVAI